MYSATLVRMRSEPMGAAMRPSTAAMTIHGCATTRWESRLNTPWSEEESPTARRTRLAPGTRLSALGRTRRPPSSVMIAGTSVIVQATATSDTLIAPTAIVLNMGERMMSSPVMEQAMVSAEKETVRPAVATVRTTLRRTSSFMSAPAGRSPSQWPVSSSWMATSSR